MADRPIIFSAPMVRALLDGTKSTTRRVLKPQKGVTLAEVEWEPNPTGLGRIGRVPLDKLKVPYAVGDRLWVREAWRVAACLDGDKPRDLRPVTEIRYEAEPGRPPGTRDLWGRLRPARFLPRRLSRLTLLVTGVKVERLQEISEEDAKAEGVEEIAPWEGVRRFRVYGKGGEELACPYGARISFSTLWDEIHGPGAWEANPFVAAITFKTVKANIDHLPAEAA